jgi:2-hydroxychromene-2-carboxylate isomerase
MRDMTAATERAEALGVFGAPTFVYRDELFWGGDRLDLLAATISSRLDKQGD